MEKQKIIAIVGLNASGKTQYVEKMRRTMASDSVRYIAFCDTYGAATDRAYYLQQRWNQHDIDSETPLTGEALERTFTLTGDDTPQRRQWQQELYTLFNFHPLLSKYVITLSSGELRKLQLIKTLLAQPSTLILDNPFIGLDEQTRQQLNELLPRLSKEKHLTIYLVIARLEDIPAYVDDFIWTTPRQQWQSASAVGGFPANPASVVGGFPANPASVVGGFPANPASVVGGFPADKSSPAPNAPEVVRFNNVTIRYGDRTILNNLDWTIRQGECWALTGPNGSGKSTLLSLICADNPQAYACDIRLFGRQRGSGETIWDIKRRIGYVSPEMHRSYRHNIPAIQVVASGIRDTVGLYTRVSDADRKQCRKWMQVFGIDDLEQRPFLTLSSGEQRLALLARAFVKEPELIILDEPLHGLDTLRCQQVRQIIQSYSERPATTLIMVTHYPHELPPCFNRIKRL